MLTPLKPHEHMSIVRKKARAKDSHNRNVGRNSHQTVHDYGIELTLRFLGGVVGVGVEQPSQSSRCRDALD